LQVSKTNIFDLTQMFGSTIADYIYSLEQANQGDGVAFFRKFFPNDYYEYNPGELMSVSGLSEHKMVGFNQWDEEWELGFYDVYGNKQSINNAIRAKNHIKVVSGAIYFFRSTNNYPHGFRIFFFDNGGNLISTITTYGNGLFETPNDCDYILYSAFTPVTQYYNDICINLSDPSRNGEYEPYQKHTYPLDSSLPLRGIPKLDSANQLYFDGDTYEADGTVTRRYGIVDLGTLKWESISENRFYSLGLPYDSVKNTRNVICSKYLRCSTDGGSQMEDKSFIVYGASLTDESKCVYVKDTSYLDVASFKASLNGVYLVYELANPITESAQPYQQLQECDPAGTEEFVYADDVSVKIPVGHTTKYISSISDKVDAITDTVKEQENIGFYIDEDGDLCQR